MVRTRIDVIYHIIWRVCATGVMIMIAGDGQENTENTGRVRHASECGVARGVERLLRVS